MKVGMLLLGITQESTEGKGYIVQGQGACSIRWSFQDSIGRISQLFFFSHVEERLIVRLWRQLPLSTDMTELNVFTQHAVLIYGTHCQTMWLVISHNHIYNVPQ